MIDPQMLNYIERPRAKTGRRLITATPHAGRCYVRIGRGRVARYACFWCALASRLRYRYLHA